MSFLRITGTLSVLAALASGCAHVESRSPQRYYFDHSVLNFERRPLYPRNFEVPPPLDAGSDESEPLVARRDEPAHSAPPSDVLAAPVSPTRHGTVARRAAEPVVAVSAPVREPELTSLPVALVRPGLGSAPELGPDGSALDDYPLATELPEERPEEGATEAAPPPAETEGLRAELVAAADRVVGIRNDFDGASFIAHVLKVNNVELPVEFGDTYVRDVYKHLKAQGLTYDREAPLPGDLVFFHNTEDRNGDSRNNDWYSLCGVVRQVDEDGTIHFVSVVRDEVQELTMNLGRPEVRRDERTASYLNSFLRSKSLSDPEYTQYLSGELYAGFASVSLP